MLQAILTLDGFHVEIAADGQQGLDAILEHRPDIAVIDIGLPKLNGYEVARRVRQQFGPSEVCLIRSPVTANTRTARPCFKPASMSTW